MFSGRVSVDVHHHLTPSPHHTIFSVIDRRHTHTFTTKWLKISAIVKVFLFEFKRRRNKNEKRNFLHTLTQTQAVGCRWIVEFVNFIWGAHNNNNNNDETNEKEKKKKTTSSANDHVYACVGWCDNVIVIVLRLPLSIVGQWQRVCVCVQRWPRKWNERRKWGFVKSKDNIEWEINVNKRSNCNKKMKMCMMIIRLHNRWIRSNNVLPCDLHFVSLSPHSRQVDCVFNWQMQIDSMCYSHNRPPTTTTYLDEFE